MVHVQPIRTEADYQAALARLDQIFQAEIGTADGDERDVLCDLIGCYEDKHYPIDPPDDPVAAIEFCMDQRNLTAHDLVPYFGTLDEVSKVLARKQEITMPVARALHEHLGIAAETLLHPVKPKP